MKVSRVIGKTAKTAMKKLAVQQKILITQADGRFGAARQTPNGNTKPDERH